MRQFEILIAVLVIIGLLEMVSIGLSLYKIGLMKKLAQEEDVAEDLAPNMKAARLFDKIYKKSPPMPVDPYTTAWEGDPIETRTRTV